MKTKSLIHTSMYLNLCRKTIENEMKNLKINLYKNYYIYINFKKILIIIFHPFDGQVLICGSGVIIIIIIIIKKKKT